VVAVDEHEYTGPRPVTEGIARAAGERIRTELRS
jgi:hypothetical protein